MSRLRFLYITGVIVCMVLSNASCTYSPSLKLRDMKDEDSSQFIGKTLGEVLEYLHERYGCYDTYTMSMQPETNSLSRCKFRYYDSSYIYMLSFYFNASEFQYLPKKVPVNNSSFLEFAFPLRLLKKEKVKSVNLEQIPIDWWIQNEKKMDSIRTEIMYEGVKEEVLKELSILEKDTLKE